MDYQQQRLGKLRVHSSNSAVRTVMRPSHGDRVDQLQLRFHKLALRTPNDGDLVALPFGLRYPAFPKSIGRIGIVDEDAVADLVSQQPRPRLWGGKSQSARPRRTFALLQDEQGRRIAVSLRELRVQAIPSRQPRSRSTRALTSRSSTRLSKAAGYLPRRTGRVVGFWGSRDLRNGHHFRAEGGKPVHAWCALDPLLIVPVIGLRARVESKRPGNRRANHSPTSTLASANRQCSASAPHADNIELPYRRSLGTGVQLVGVAFE